MSTQAATDDTTAWERVTRGRDPASSRLRPSTNAEATWAAREVLCPQTVAPAADPLGITHAEVSPNIATAELPRLAQTAGQEAFSQPTTRASRLGAWIR